MIAIAGGIFLLVGLAMVIFARRFARAGLSFYFSDEDLDPNAGPRRSSIRLALAGVTIVDAVLGLLAIYVGIRLLSLSGNLCVAR
jgi:hypothetical protein